MGAACISPPPPPCYEERNILPGDIAPTDQKSDSSKADTIAYRLATVGIATLRRHTCQELRRDVVIELKRRAQLSPDGVVDLDIINDAVGGGNRCNESRQTLKCVNVRDPNGTFRVICAPRVRLVKSNISVEPAVYTALGLERGFVGHRTSNKFFFYVYYTADNDCFVCEIG